MTPYIIALAVLALLLAWTAKKQTHGSIGCATQLNKQKQMTETHKPKEDDIS